jgi:hypothetical protein
MGLRGLVCFGRHEKSWISPASHCEKPCGDSFYFVSRQLKLSGAMIRAGLLLKGLLANKKQGLPSAEGYRFSVRSLGL